jgi:hypothetical protein
MDQPTPTTTELAARPTGEGLYKFIEGYCGFPNAAWDHPTEPDWCTGAKEREAWNAMAAILNGRLESLTADRDHWKAESERLAAEVERLSGLIHSCPKCGEFCKQCRCWNDELAEARAIILEGGFNPRQREDDYHLRRDAFLARTATAEGGQPSKSVEKRLNVRDGKGPLGEDMRAIQALHRPNLIREARASCSLDGDTQSEGDSYVLISEDRLKRYESEVRRLKDELQHNRVAFDERRAEYLQHLKSNPPTPQETAIVASMALRDVAEVLQLRSELAELREKVRRLEGGALNKDQEPNGDES